MMVKAAGLAAALVLFGSAKAAYRDVGAAP